MRWVWDPDKDAANRAKHRLSFTTAVRVFDDPLHLSIPDPHPGGDRWQTLGLIGRVVVLVAHTWPDDVPGEDEPVGRIITARKATAHERRVYEEGEV
jgi:uncharacterized DUF497 family protein